MKQSIFLTTAAVCGLTFGCQKPAQDKPNVIVILTDDQGYGDFSCNGNPILSTPNLDKLYNESVRFSNFHVAPVCTPTRGQLMTGLDAMDNKACMVPNGRNLMRRDIITMPEVFRQNGYKTGIFGKWHLGDSYPDRPMDRGFEKCIWHQGWGLPSEIEFDNDYYNTRYLDSLTSIVSKKYCTDLWFEKAIEWMEDMHSENQPFFTYLALNTPHGPLYAPKEDSAFYGGRVTGPEAMFFGMIKNIDDNYALLEKWLDEKKLKENTIIVFMNDNGGTVGVKIYNAGMRGKKGDIYDGGHRATCFIRWPEGKTIAPQTIGYPSNVQDILPTLIDLAELNVPEGNQFDGQSLKPYLYEEKGRSNDRMFVVQYGGRNQPEKYAGCVVWNSWRLVGKDELYDLDKDPGQVNNIAAKHPDIVETLLQFYEEWWNEIEPGLKEIVPVIVGNEKCNPVLLTSNNWVGVDADNQKAVAMAVGPPKGGLFYINVEITSKYKLELSRWPFHLNRDLTIEGPDKTIGGQAIPAGRAIPVFTGCAAINDNPPVFSNKMHEADCIAIEMELPAGNNTLQTWFKDEKGVDLCGAYYVKITKL